MDGQEPRRDLLGQVLPGTELRRWDAAGCSAEMQPWTFSCARKNVLVSHQTFMPEFSSSLAGRVLYFKIVIIRNKLQLQLPLVALSPVGMMFSEVEQVLSYAHDVLRLRAEKIQSHMGMEMASGEQNTHYFQGKNKTASKGGQG